ncbi:hypothetical protein ACFX4N_23935 [Priestia sp. YIM B13551]|uniref:hypothetical protein n=1 Tax=Priestia sp. YIM B13551 TaxID=3366306 RepID=UPI00366CD132
MYEKKIKKMYRIFDTLYEFRVIAELLEDGKDAVKEVYAVIFTEDDAFEVSCELASIFDTYEKAVADLNDYNEA